MPLSLEKKTQLAETFNLEKETSIMNLQSITWNNYIQKCGFTEVIL